MIPFNYNLNHRSWNPFQSRLFPCLHLVEVVVWLLNCVFLVESSYWAPGRRSSPCLWVLLLFHSFSSCNRIFLMWIWKINPWFCWLSAWEIQISIIERICPPEALVCPHSARFPGRSLAFCCWGPCTHPFCIFDQVISHHYLTHKSEIFAFIW